MIKIGVHNSNTTQPIMMVLLPSMLKSPLQTSNKEKVPKLSICGWNGLILKIGEKKILV
eukprot:UN04564